MRWKLSLDQFELVIIYRKGLDNLEGADTLSRLICSADTPLVQSGPPIPTSSVFLAQAVLSYSPLSCSSIREFDMWSRLPETESTGAHMPASFPLHTGSSLSVARVLATGLNLQTSVSAALASAVEANPSMPELNSFAPSATVLPHPPTVVSPPTAVTVLPRGDTALPANWQEGRNQCGRTFYIDHTNKRVTLSEPRSNGCSPQ